MFFLPLHMWWNWLRCMFILPVCVCVCLHCRWWGTPFLSRIIAVNSRPHRAERISAQLINKTLFPPHSVGESATAVLVWHLCRLITEVKAAFERSSFTWSHSPFRTWPQSRLSGQVCQWEQKEILTTGRAAQMQAAFLMRLEIYPQGKRHVIFWVTFMQV